MNEKNIELPIRSALIPVYYQKFHCLAQACRDSCCVNWSITFDKKDYLRLRRLDAPPALRERLEQGVRREKKGNHDGVHYGKFDLNSRDARCPFLDEDGLCAIQRACGHDALPEVCTTYPRYITYTPVAREYTLVPSCEGVLQQLWDLPNGVEFVEDPLPKAEWRNYSISPGDHFKLYFAPVRDLCIDILQNRALSLTERMLCLGMIIQRLQREDWSTFDPDRWVEQAALLAGSDTFRKMDIPRNWEMYLMQNVNVLGAIPLMDNSWVSELEEVLKIRRTVSASAREDGTSGYTIQATGYTIRAKTDVLTKVYADSLAKFQDAFSDYEYFFENLMVAAALCQEFPELGSKEALWKSYVSLCNLYSFYRFVSVLSCKDEATRERLFHMIVMASRATLHNFKRFSGYQEQLFKNDSSTLAHMAILLRWD